LIGRKALDFSEIHWLVLDEADEMLSMGFKDDLETILAKLLLKNKRYFSLLR
jgi:ATP-dependent RNA helicase DeaD